MKAGLREQMIKSKSRGRFFRRNLMMEGLILQPKKKIILLSRVFTAFYLNTSLLSTGIFNVKYT